jgi:hypothetical protein
MITCMLQSSVVGPMHGGDNMYAVIECTYDNMYAAIECSRADAWG